MPGWIERRKRGLLSYKVDKVFYYFVSYKYYSDEKDGYGMIEMNLSRKVKNFGDVKLMKQWIVDNCTDGLGNNLSVVILNYQELSEKYKY